MSPGNYYTVSQVSEMTGLDKRKILYRIRTEKIKKARKMGWFWVIHKSELDKINKELSQNWK